MTNPETDARAERTRRRLTGDRNQCPTCGEFFNSTTAFDAHRTGPFGGANGRPARRRCLSADEMRAKGMTVNTAGFWIIKTHTAASLARKKAQEALRKTLGADGTGEDIG